MSTKEQEFLSALIAQAEFLYRRLAMFESLNRNDQGLADKDVWDAVDATQHCLARLSNKLAATQKRNPKINLPPPRKSTKENRK